MIRPILMVALLVAACFTTWRFSPHHHATKETVFTTMFMHLVPAPLVAPGGDGADAAHGVQGPGDTGHDPNEVAAEEGHADDGHAAGTTDGHAHATPLLSIPLPGFLAAFDGDPVHEGPQLVLYNLQVFQFAALLMLFLAFSGVPRYLRTGEGDAITRLMAGFCLWARDEMILPAMGEEVGRKFLPYVLYLFFFILFMNLMGLTPMSVTPTASIFVTAALALVTFALMIAGGMVANGPVGFVKSLTPDVPIFLFPLIFVIEVAGLFIKPFALMIRLFANLTGGHMVVLSFLALIFFFLMSYGPTIGLALAPAWLGFAVFVMIIEAFVAMVQAYIFALLTALFVGASIHPEH